VTRSPENSRPALLLLSGLLCDETIWSDIPQRLEPVADVSVISFTGLSSIERMARYALQAAPQRFAVAGHSMGGRVALEMMRIAPARITALALLNTGVHAVRDGEFQGRSQLLRIAVEHGMTALAREWLPPLMGTDTARTAELLPRLSAMVERCSVANYADQNRAMLQRPDALTVMPNVTVPTLLLSGSDDTWSPISQQETIRRRIPHATLFEVHGAGHMAPIEKPDAVSLALREWLLKD
jgi:pimeloyl-ACP methyl ester carboxylesterase